MRRADVDPGVKETRTVDLPDITKSVQEPDCEPDPALVGAECGLLATFDEIGSMSTSIWDIEKLPHRNDAVFPPLL
jgi:hypothetical protein